MAISFIVAGNARNSGAPAVLNTTGANLLVAFTADALTDYSPPIDNQSNTWVGCTGQTAGVAYGKIWYVYNPTTNSSHSFYPTNGGFNVQAMVVAAFSGVASSPLDQQNGINDINPFPGTTKQLGSVTPTEDSELIVSFASYRFSSAGPPSISGGGGFSPLDGNNATNQNVIGFFLIQSSAAASNPTYTFAEADSGYGVGCVATFKAGGGGGGGGNPWYAYAQQRRKLRWFFNGIIFAPEPA